MTSITFDTHAAIKRLVAVGVPEAQAEAEIEILASLVRDELVTKDHLDLRLAPILVELTMVKWMVGGVGFGILLLVLKSFWPGM